MPEAAASHDLAPPAPHATPPSTLRARLRDATADAHARLDAQLGALDLGGRDGYRVFLEANAAALLPLEDALEQAGVARLFPDWTSRSRRDAIRADLARMGGTTRPLAVAPLPDIGSVLGTMYVLEGSRLGAAVLLKQVAASPDPAVAGATAYLAHGAGERLWPSFLALLEQHGARLGYAAGVIDGANQAFALFAAAAPAAAEARP
jgi:heme oxygenase